MLTPSNIFLRAIIAALLVLGLLAALVAIAAAQTIDRNLWITNGRVNAMARSGNTLYVGGAFTVVGPRTGGGMPVDTATAAVDFAAPDVRGTVRVAIGDGADGWFIGGSFDSVGGLPRANLARIRADLTVDPWNPGTVGEVLALCRAGGRVLVGGSFTTLAGQAKARLGAVDEVTGALAAWPVPAPNGQVTGIAVLDTSVFIGGWFNFMGATARGFLAEVGLLSGALHAWNPGASTFVDHLSLQNGRVYAGGQFTTVAAQPRTRTVCFDAASRGMLPWSPLVTTGSSTVTSILDDGAQVYIGGSFTTVQSTGRLFLARVDADSGRVLPWNAQLNGQVLSMQLVNGKLYLAGGFTSVRSTRRYRLACVDTAVTDSTGQGALLPWHPVASSFAYALCPGGSRLFVGGSYTSLGGVERNNAAAFDLTTGAATPFDPNTVGDVNSIVIHNGDVYIGGAMLSVGGSPSSLRLVKLDPVTGAPQAWQPNVNSIVNEIYTDGSTLWLGGLFTTVGGQVRNRVAAIDLATAAVLPFDANASGSVNAFALSGGTLYLGGAFSNMGGQPRNRLAAVDPVTGALLPWNPNSSGTVSALLPSGASLLVGGSFSTIGGQSRSNLAEIETATGLATSWAPNPNSSVEAMTLSGPTLYCVGGFTTIGGLARGRVAALDRVSGVPTAWAPDVRLSTLNALTTGVGRVFFGGTLLSVNGIARSNLAGLWDPSIPNVGVPLGGRDDALVSLAPVAPDPLRARGQVRFTLASAGGASLDVLDVSGRRVRSLLARAPLAAGTHVLPLERGGLAAGVYFLRLTLGSATASRRFVALP